MEKLKKIIYLKIKKYKIISKIHPLFLRQIV